MTSSGRVLVYGIGVAGASTVAALRRRGVDVVAADDVVDDSKRELAGRLGVELVEAPDPASTVALVAAADLVVPAPGVPEHHQVISAARRAEVPLRSEIDLAYEWEQQRPGGPRPMLAVTGTDGKTTTALMAVDMLRAAGLTSVAAGNTEVPLVDALEMPVGAFVVECASFRLAWTTMFRAEAAVWLNLAPDHLNWHSSLDSYEAAKARIWELQRPSDVAIGYADDAVVMRRLATAPAKRRTFALAGADYRRHGDDLVGPTGVLAPVAVLRRALPHDLTNALAAAALVLETGLAHPAAVAEALAGFVGPPHRIEPIAETGGVHWFDDSKATTPHAAAAAIRSFEQVVLIAGGRNKGLDLAPMAAEPHRLRAVIAIGEAAGSVAALFEQFCPVDTATSMTAAVTAAAARARPGDTVLLSPGCASFDWYGGFEERGDDFRRQVEALVARNGGSER